MMRRLKYEVMDWIDEHTAVRVPLVVTCILAVCGLVLRCGNIKAGEGIPTNAGPGASPLRNTDLGSRQAGDQASPLRIGGDLDGNGQVDISDCVWLINYIFAGGPEPVACECAKSFFLFDDRIPQVVETYYVDSNWEEVYIGGRTFVRGGPVRRVYSIGPDSQPSWFLMVPDTVVLAEADTIGSFMMSSVVGAESMQKYGGAWSEGAIYRQPDFKAIWRERYSHRDTIPVVDEPDSLTVLWRDDWHAAWVDGEITCREYLDLRLHRQDYVLRVLSKIPKGVVIDSVKAKWEAAQ